MKVAAIDWDCAEGDLAQDHHSWYEQPPEEDWIISDILDARSDKHAASTSIFKHRRPQQKPYLV